VNSLLNQLQTFILTGLTGVAAGFIFHYYQLTVRKARIGKYFLYILDFYMVDLHSAIGFCCHVTDKSGRNQIVYYTYLICRRDFIFLFFFRKINQDRGPRGQGYGIYYCFFFAIGRYHSRMAENMACIKKENLSSSISGIKRIQKNNCISRKIKLNQECNL
jgi:hypothetical protein